MKYKNLLFFKESIREIAAKYHIQKVYVFGSVSQRQSKDTSDVDFLIELEQGASALGVGGFQFEVQELLGINVDVIPTFVLPRIDDREFVMHFQSEALAL